MKATMGRKTSWLDALLLILWGGSAFAQGPAEPMRSQQPPPPAPSIQTNASQPTLELPTSASNPVLELPGKEPEPALSLVLPSPFVGCWEGTINGWDSLTPIAFLSSLSRGTHSTYTFCYLPNPDGKSYRLEFRKVIIAEKELQQTGFENQVVWVDDANRTGYLRNHLTAVQTAWLLFIPLHVREESYAEEIVVLENPNLIRMRGRQLIKIYGQDHAQTEFHADFYRIPEAPLSGVSPSAPLTDSTP